ncbi:MAG: stage III sporulation protein AF [Eubacterium sp.]|nr:stage III sporulation protein AF [Eubacterium sp.]
MNAVLNWMKEFLILYLVLTILTQLAAAEEYKKYLRFLSGMVLLLVLVSPALRLFGNGGGNKILSSYDAFWENMDGFASDLKETELLQQERQLEQYEKAAAEELITQAQAQGITVSHARVDISDSYEVSHVAVWLDAQQKQEDPAVRDRMVQLLKETYQLQERQIFID